jgi:hypothetical protein
MKECTGLLYGFVLSGNLLQTFRRTLRPPSFGQSRNYPDSEDGSSTILRNVCNTRVSKTHIPGSSNLHQERKENRSHDYQYMDCMNCGSCLPDTSYYVRHCTLYFVQLNLTLEPFLLVHTFWMSILMPVM